MKLHPASKEASKILRRLRYQHYRKSNFVFSIHRDHDHILVDVKLSAHSNLAKFEVCTLYSDNPLYEEVSGALHGLTFPWGES